MAVLIFGYMNVYKSGHFHRCGKPHAFDRHAGDFYPTQEAARQDIQPASHYICTVPIVWMEEEEVKPNSDESRPIPLHITRRQP